MKILIGLTLLLFMQTGFTDSKVKSSHLYLLSEDCDSVPQLNREILNFVKTKLNKKVGRGECAELAGEALKSIGAKYNGKYVFGKRVDYKNECVYPGDIIQFEGVKIDYMIGEAKHHEEMPHHTAIVYEVNSKGNYELAHQNYNNRKRVIISSLELKNVTRGKLIIYRPTK